MGKKIERCKFIHIPFPDKNGKIHFQCKLDSSSTDETRCETCENFKSRYIEYPISVNKISGTDFEFDGGLYKNQIGTYCSVRPCGEEYKNKTYLGILLGEIPMGVSARYHNDSGELTMVPMYNPAIYVFELKKIIFGAESWWQKIEDPEDLREITQESIDSQWYVQLAKAMQIVENEKEK